MPTTPHARPGNPRLADRWLAFDRTGCPRRRDELVAALMPTVRAVVAHACRNGGQACAASLGAAGRAALVAAVESYGPTDRSSLEQHAWTAVVAAVGERMPQPPLAHPLAA